MPAHLQHGKLRFSAWLDAHPELQEGFAFHATAVLAATDSLARLNAAAALAGNLSPFLADFPSSGSLGIDAGAKLAKRAGRRKVDAHLAKIDGHHAGTGELLHRIWPVISPLLPIALGVATAAPERKKRVRKPKPGKPTPAPEQPADSPAADPAPAPVEAAEVPSSPESTEPASPAPVADPVAADPVAAESPAVDAPAVDTGAVAPAAPEPEAEAPAPAEAATEVETDAPAAEAEEAPAAEEAPEVVDVEEVTEAPAEEATETAPEPAPEEAAKEKPAKADKPKEGRVSGSLLAAVVLTFSIAAAVFGGCCSCDRAKGAEPTPAVELVAILDVEELGPDQRVAKFYHGDPPGLTKPAPCGHPECRVLVNSTAASVVCKRDPATGAVTCSQTRPVSSSSCSSGSCSSGYTYQRRGLFGGIFRRR